MNILDFYKEYPDELSCKLKFKEIRDKVGIICKKCQGSEHYWKQGWKELLQPVFLIVGMNFRHDYGQAYY